MTTSHAEEVVLAMAQATMQNAINKSKLSRAEIARRMNCPKSYITRILSGGHNLTLRTYVRLLCVCGHELELKIVRRI